MQRTGWLAGLGASGGLGLAATTCFIVALMGGPDSAVQRAALEMPLQGLKSVARTSTELAEEARAALESSGEAVLRYRSAVERQHRYLVVGSALAALTLMAVAGFAAAAVGAGRRRAARAIEQSDNRARSQALYVLDELDRLARGDFNPGAREFAGDGILADAIDEVADTLGRHFGNVRRTADSLLQCAGATQSRMSSSKTAVDRYIGISGDVATAVTDLSSVNEQISSEFAQCTSASEQLTQVVRRVAESVGVAMSSLEHLRQARWETTERAERLQGSARELEGVVQIVDDLANQTEVLALNAAIQESSIDGPAQGLVRLADEVHRMADRSRQVLGRVRGWIEPGEDTSPGAPACAEGADSESTSELPPAPSCEHAVRELEERSRALVGHLEANAQLWQQQALRIEALSREADTVAEAAAQANDVQGATLGSAKELARFAEDLRALLKDFQLPQQASDNVVDLRPGATADASTITNPPMLEHVEIQETG